LPGPSAVVTAISGAGDFLKYGDGGFQFLGFLPTKANQRDAVIQRAQLAGVSSFFYEAPHRIENSLKAIAQLLEKDRKILIAKELTKVFEEIHVISVADLPDWMSSVKNWQGEFVIGIEGQPPTASPSSFDENTKNWIHAIGDKVGHKELSEIVSVVTGISKKDAYKELMDIKKK
jgi:16S rRNA (cytidine1402-2'-O)-methyltransferase